MSEQTTKGNAYPSDGPLCYHPENGKLVALQRRGTDAPCNMIKLCDCGANASCPACGWGYGAVPCACRPAPSMTFFNYDLSLEDTRSLQCMVASELVLAKGWNTPEEDAAWSHL